MSAFPEYPIEARLSAEADSRLTMVASGSRFIDIYSGHTIEEDKRFCADLSTALNEITVARRADAHDWSAVASEVLTQVEPAMIKVARRVADDLYDTLLSGVQDNLADNATFNLGSRLDSAERERRAQWERAERLEQKLFDALSALKLAKAYLDCSLGSPSWKGENPYPVIEAALLKASPQKGEG